LDEAASAAIQKFAGAVISHKNESDGTGFEILVAVIRVTSDCIRGC
jgi:hypothetical protein